MVCHADTNIACGTRAKPLFIEFGMRKSILEAKISRGGTAIFIRWDTSIKSMQSADTSITGIFKDNKINAIRIIDSARIKELLKNLDEKSKWYSSSEIDQLLKDEAEAITKKGLSVAMDQGLVNAKQEDSLRVSVKNYYNKEFVNIKTYEELTDTNFRKMSDKDLYKTLAKYVDQKKAMGIFKIFNDLTFRTSYLADSVSIDPCCIELENQ